MKTMRIRRKENGFALEKLDGDAWIEVVHAARLSAILRLRPDAAPVAYSNEKNSPRIEKAIVALTVALHALEQFVDDHGATCDCLACDDAAGIGYMVRGAAVTLESSALAFKSAALAIRIDRTLDRLLSR